MEKLLNPVVAKYINSGNARNEEEFVACFASDAVVYDESHNHNHNGLEEIRAWYRRTQDEYDFQAEPKEFSEDGDEASLVCTVSGNFPGSPVDLSYRFKLDSGKISELRID